MVGAPGGLPAEALRGPPSRYALRWTAFACTQSEGWAHLEFTGINTTPTILPKKIEDVREADTSISNRQSKIVRFRTLAVLFDLECEHWIDARGPRGGDAARDYRNRRQAE